MNVSTSSEAAVALRPPLPTDLAAREARIVEHYRLVHVIASRMARRFPSHVDIDDLVEAGTLGLIDAVDRYDESRGVPLRSYAEIRIRGAIVDAMRSADWTPRAVRQFGARVEAARETLRSRDGRDPDVAAVAGELGLPIETFARDRSRAAPRRVVSLDAPATDGSGTHADEVADDAPNALERCLAADLGKATRAAVEALPERERTVLKLYYEGELSLKEIGARLGLCESRVCQLHGAAVKRLQRILRPLVTA